jgi:putative ABC transport system permease protein
MIRFNFLLAFRSILKNKTTSFINLFGLSVAFTALVLILMYVIGELSYDLYHEKGDRIFRVTRQGIDAEGKPSIHFGHVNFAFAPQVTFLNRWSKSFVLRITRIPW